MDFRFIWMRAREGSGLFTSSPIGVPRSGSFFFVKDGAP